MNTGFWLLDRFAVWFFDCTANPSRECLAVPPLVYMAVAAFLVLIGFCWSLLKTGRRFQHASLRLFIAAISFLAAGALGVAGWRFIRANPTWLGPLTENLASLAFIVLGMGLALLPIAVGSAAGTRLAMLRTGGGRPGKTS